MKNIYFLLICLHLLKKSLKVNFCKTLFYTDYFLKKKLIFFPVSIQPKKLGRNFFLPTIFLIKVNNGNARTVKFVQTQTSLNKCLYSAIRSFSSPYFPGKIGTRKTLNTDTFYAVSVLKINRFLTINLMLYPLKIWKNRRFSGVFREYKLETLTRNELIQSFFTKIVYHIISENIFIFHNDTNRILGPYRVSMIEVFCINLVKR